MAFSLKLLIEGRREFNVQTHLAATDFEKAFDRVIRCTFQEIMERNGYP